MTTGYCRLAQPADRAVADVISTGDLHQRLPGFPSCDGFSLLVRGKLGVPTKLHPSRYRPRTSLPGSCPDKFTFKFGEAAEYGQHQPTVGRRGVPSIRAVCDLCLAPDVQECQK